jgi:TM2 domain-containing membrane protein YozV|tara:strand:- start:1240 stop:1536 length:297 start_codon:yes stop_codon:yes gene_type:complete
MRKLILSYAFLMGLGFAGAHRFYLGRTYTAVLYLCTGGLCGIGVILDFFMIPFMVAEDINDEGGDVLGFLLKLFVSCVMFSFFCFLVSGFLFLLLNIF